MVEVSNVEKRGKSREKKLTYQHQVPPKILTGQKITGMKYFAYFPGKSSGLGGRIKIEKCPPTGTGAQI